LESSVEEVEKTKEENSLFEKQEEQAGIRQRRIASTANLTRADLMVQYRGFLQKTKTNSRIYKYLMPSWSAHTFASQPCIIPEREEGSI
jgi:hypothetical protein